MNIEFSLVVPTYKERDNIDKLVTDTHTSKPNLLGPWVSFLRIGTPGPRNPLRCHFPKCPVA